MDNTYDANTATDSSTEADVGSLTATDVGTQTGASPTPPDESKRRSLLDVVRNAAIRRTMADGESSTSARYDESSGASGERADNSSNGGDSNEENIPFHNHPRWKEMMRERAQLAEKAKHYEEISDYMRANGLSNTELAQGFEVMALMKNDPFKAKELLNEHMSKLSEVTGDILPVDIQEKLDNGFIDQEAAREIASYRARTQMSAKATEEYNAKVAAEAETARKQDMYQAVVDWESKVSMRDSEYRNKQALVTDRVKSIMQQAGNPNSPEDAVKYVEQAYNEVNQRLGSLAGRNTPTRMPTSYNSSSSGNSAPQPRSLQEAVLWAARRGGSAR
jgi:hypothetical protein